MKNRKINEIIVHCTDTDYMHDVSVADLRQWHVVERGFTDIGYHYFIDLLGRVHVCRPLYMVGAHCKGHNSNSIGICYAGGRVNGYFEDTRTIVQKESLNNLIRSLCNDYPITSIVGHNKYSRKSCPCFDAEKEYKHLIKNLL